MKGPNSVRQGLNQRLRAPYLLGGYITAAVLTPYL